MPVSHPLAAWLIAHTCVILNTSVRGGDGKTAWARARGRPFGMKMYGVGESALWELPSKGPQHDAQGNMAPRLLPGEFGGFHKEPNSYRVIAEKGDVWKTTDQQTAVPRKMERRKVEGDCSHPLEPTCGNGSGTRRRWTTG